MNGSTALQLSTLYIVAFSCLFYRQLKGSLCPQDTDTGQHVMKDTEPFVITVEWLNDNKTKAGGYTRAQIEAVGVSWPLVSGWKRDLVGQMITPSMAAKFERSAAKRLDAKSKSLKGMDSCVAYISNNITELKPGHIKSLMDSINKSGDK